AGACGAQCFADCAKGVGSCTMPICIRGIIVNGTKIAKEIGVFPMHPPWQADDLSCCNRKFFSPSICYMPYTAGYTLLSYPCRVRSCCVGYGRRTGRGQQPALVLLCSSIVW